MELNPWPASYYIVPQPNGNQVTYEYGRLGYARPIQVALQAPAWFKAKVVSPDSNSFDSVHVPVLALTRAVPTYL
jgi:hypothetical protein